jgi:hypothetical protein
MGRGVALAAAVLCLAGGVGAATDTVERSAAGTAVITLDAVSSTGAGSGTSLAWPHTVGVGNHRMLVVGVGIESQPDRPVSSMTFGSQTLTPVPGGRAAYSGSKANATELWYLPSPAVTSATITVTFSGSVGSSAGGAVSLFGVNQGPPEAVSAFASLGGDGAYALSITTQTDRAWVVDVVNNGEAVNSSFTPGVGQTERWDLLGNNAFRLAGSTREVTPAGEVTNTWQCVTPTPSREAHSMAAFAPLKRPDVAITSPTNGETVSRANLIITADASGGVGVTNVQFYADDSLIGSDSSAPYTWTWSSAPLGDHTLTAKAYDAAGTEGVSAPVAIHVTTNLPPRVSITHPVNGMVVGTNVMIAATATDDVAVTNVYFYDGSTLLGSDAASPYSLVWNGAPLGPHTLKAVAWDDTGLSSTSTVAVTVILQQAQYVIVISVDGMGSAYVTPLLTSGLANELTTFKRIQAEGSGTLNARDDADFAVTLPNHVTMMTGRGVLGAAGHNWTDNGDPLPTDTIENNKGSYVASGFDVAHDNGLRTGIWSGKSKFSLFQQSYGDTTGLPDATDPDNGRDKIDFDKVESYIPASELTADFTNRMAASPFHFVFFHYQDPDTAGHATGWSTNIASAFAATLKNVDTQIGRILQMVESTPALQGHTAIIVTADHGGHGYTHGDTTNPLDFTIPFYVWGASVVAGGDLYAMNPIARTSPEPTANPPYTGPQPVRNGDAANLALSLLGLGPVPGSTINTAQDLHVDAAQPPQVSIRGESGLPLLEWIGSSAWYYTMEFTPSLAPFVPWTNVLGVVLVPGVDGPMSAVDTNDIPGGFYRIKMTQ